MKILFSILLFLHAAIHLLGFFKAFGLAEIPQLTRNIPKPLGALWLLCVLIFLYVLWLFLFQKNSWPFFALAAVLISQSLIVLSWENAKFGTIFNLAIFLVGLPALGHFYFENRMKNELRVFIQQSGGAGNETMRRQEISSLPSPVQNWLRESGGNTMKSTGFVYVEQQGNMKTKPDGSWMPFSARQYIDVQNPGFLWITKVTPSSFFYMNGRDKLRNGQGEMLIQLYSLMPVVKEEPGPKINEGAMHRFLAEICWFPPAALHKDISWEALDENSARASLRQDGKEASGIFRFSEEGKIISFEADRYYGGGEDAKKEKWFVEALEYREFSGYIIPYKCRLIWKLPEGDFTWLEVEISRVQPGLSVGEISG